MTAAERREMQRLLRQRDALLDTLASLVNLGNLGLMPGMAYAEIHGDDLRNAERVVKRMRKQLTTPRPLAV